MIALACADVVDLPAVDRDDAVAGLQSRLESGRVWVAGRALRAIR